MRSSLSICVLLISFLGPAFFSFPASAQTNPIDRFNQVNAHIYRGARPGQDGVAALVQYNVTTILDLENDDDAIAAETQFAAQNGIQFISTPMSAFWSPDDQQVKANLKLLSEPGDEIIFVHCQHGEDRTGLIIGLYRVFHDQWSAQQAWNEMENLGFHRILFGLTQYFEQATGFALQTTIALPYSSRQNFNF